MCWAWLSFLQMLISERMVMALSILFTKADRKGSARGSGLPRGLFLLFFQTIPLQGHLDQNIFALNKNTWIHFSFKKTLALIIDDNNYCW